MRRLETSGMVLVHLREAWPHATLPCSRDMTAYLEKGEHLVFWLQPVDGGPADQIPALLVGGGYYALSLRMMKAIWRHVRLGKHFRNIERSCFGRYKLRIPLPLMREKKRTQSRFNVSDVADGPMDMFSSVV